MLMRPRVAGRIALGTATVILVLTALVVSIDTDEQSAYHGLQAITYAILALTTAVCYRYFED
jgi:hypothetical protein